MERHRRAADDGSLPVSSLRPSVVSRPGRAWVLCADEACARQLEAELLADGWQVGVRVSSMQHLLLHLYCEAQPPDVLVCGLHFEDGDALRLMRLLCGDEQAPLLFFAAQHQPRGVLKSVLAMAQCCKLEAACCLEPSAGQGQVAQALRNYRRSGARKDKAMPPELPLSELRAMLDGGRLEPWLQPQVRLASRDVVCVEALMRGVSSDGAPLGPARLLPALHQHGLLEEATLLMVRQLCEFLAACVGDGLPLRGALNVSLRLLADESFCAELQQAVRRCGLEPSRLTLEVDEHDLLGDLTTVIENTTRCRLMGFGLALDHFGTAYSSPLQLSQLPFSELKMDGSLVAGMATDAAKQAIVASSTSLARGLGLRVVAEGVQSPSELRAVREAGCTEAQGYLLMRPMSMQAMRQWLRGLDGLRMPAEEELADDVFLKRW
ncbi:EAL domain-containing response regulator [Azohydromonas lata]|uniref:EAL domain-containing response regulator n=1 Tax=Azohydromonas lata TaxID=45677 RepID=UPI0012F4FF50|nr:EAL domain-containing protein [Azohydromonas lata]